jgi:hypothetical protein
MNQTSLAIDSALFKQTITFLKQTNELSELFLNITPTDYKAELNIAKEIILNQDFEISKVINDLTSQSKEVPTVYKDLFKANQTIVRLITLIPAPKNFYRDSKPRRLNLTSTSNGNR